MHDGCAMEVRSLGCKLTAAEKEEAYPYSICLCPKDEKIPEKEWKFYLNQCNTRTMFIEKVDTQGSKDLQKDLLKLEQKSLARERLEKRRRSQSSSFSSVSGNEYNDVFGSSDDDTDATDSGTDFEEELETASSKWEYPNAVSFALQKFLVQT